MPSRSTRRTLGIAASLLALGIGAPAAVASAQPDDTAPAATTTAAPLFDAIVNLGGCSGSIVRHPRATDADRAVILTNGHCLPGSIPAPAYGTAVINRPLSMTGVVLKGPRAAEAGEITVDQVAYATTTDTDIAVLRTTLTYAQVKDSYGVTARTLRALPTAAGAKVAVVSGFWKHDWHCSVDTVVPQLVEANWKWKDALRTGSGCDGYKGQSGSPLLDENTGEIVGVHNTSTNGGTPCSLDNPCEVDATGQRSMRPQQSYAQQTSGLIACAGPTGALDLSAPGCTLPGATSRTVSGASDKGEALASVSTTQTPPAATIINGRAATTTGGTVAFNYGLGTVCTGSLIAPDKVLTATHCLGFSSRPGAYSVRIGSLDAARGGFLVPVKALKSENDITVATLAWTSYSDERPVQLADADPAVGTKTTAKGYGRTSTTVPTATKSLNETTLTISSLQSRDAYGGPAMAATGDSTTPYKGDSGGPLFGPDGRQVGTVSTGEISRFLTNYASVARHRAFIRANAGV